MRFAPLIVFAGWAIFGGSLVTDTRMEKILLLAFMIALLYWTARELIRRPR